MQDQHLKTKIGQQLGGKDIQEEKQFDSVEDARKKLDQSHIQKSTTTQKGAHEIGGEHVKVPIARNEMGCALNYLILYVSDVKKSCEWYSQLFGFKPRAHHTGEWTELDTGATTLAFKHADHSEAQHKQAHSCGTAGPGFLVKNLEEFHKRALSKGIKCVQEPLHQEWGGKRAAYCDPDNVTVAVVEWDQA